MSIAATTSDIATRRVRLAAIELTLGVSLCRSHRQFLLGAESFTIDGYRICGLGSSPGELSVLDGTQVVRARRPDLPTSFVAVAFSSQFALCLDGNTSLEDASLVQIDLKSQRGPAALRLTFSEWIDQHRETAARFRVAWNRVRARQAEKRRGRQATQWTAVINGVADYVVGLVAFRLNERQGCLEIDEFLPIDQPHIEPGEPLKTLLNEVLARARDYTGSLNLIFTRDTREDTFGKIPDTQAEASRNLREEVKKGLYGRLKQGFYPFCKGPISLDSTSANFPRRFFVAFKLLTARQTSRAAS